MTNEDLWPDYYDIVILPPPAVQQHAIGLSQQLQAYGSNFVLGTERFIPHISLYHVPVRKEQFDAFSNVVREVAAQHAGGTLRLVSMEMPVLMTDKPEWLTRLHVQMVRQTSRFLDREYGAERTWNTDYLPADLAAPAQRYLEEFGSPLINEVFRPHITLTTFEDKALAQRLPGMDFERMSFEVDAVSICELGRSHSCQRIQATYPLMPSEKKAL
jgi:hypothetical protein